MHSNWNDLSIFKTHNYDECAKFAFIEQAIEFMYLTSLPTTARAAMESNSLAYPQQGTETECNNHLAMEALLYSKQREIYRSNGATTGQKIMKEL